MISKAMLLSPIQQELITSFRRRAFSESERGRPITRRPRGRSKSPYVLALTYTATTFGGSEDDGEESGGLSEKVLRVWARKLIVQWLDNGTESYLAFEALLELLEIALDTAVDHYAHFSTLLTALGPESIISFLKEALPYLVDSDFQFQTDYIDILLLYLTLYQVHSGIPVLEDFVEGVTEFGGLYLRQHGKMFQELYAYIHSSEDRFYDEEKKVIRIKIQPHYLTCMHVAEKKVIVSNAPPVKLKRRRLLAKEKFECDVSAGGLVSGIKPSLQHEDVWYGAYFTLELKRD